jgi:hypothetical protein
MGADPNIAVATPWKYLLRRLCQAATLYCVAAQAYIRNIVLIASVTYLEIHHAGHLLEYL